MGLAGTKNKRKWAKDPNNTAWSRNTDTFGQKILRSQGWAPGQYLGAKDAAQTEFYSAANASHIRAVLKDDNLGLGARRNQGDECTGLDALQELLGRLNGKSQESLDEDKKKREDVRINKYLHRKLGTLRFVYGGLLVGDKVQELADELRKEKDAAAIGKTTESSESPEATGGKGNKSKKRKVEDDNDVIPEKKKLKKSKKHDSEDAEDESKAKRKEKKEKKKRRETPREDSVPDSNAERQSSNDAEPKADDIEDATSWKKTKKNKKEKRKKSKDGESADAGEASDSQSKKKQRKSSRDDKTEAGKAAPAQTVSSTPNTTGTSTPAESVPHRHLARKRFIAQKRAAVMDQAALNQIFMIKA